MFENITGILMGQVVTFVDFSALNKILPTIRPWIEGFFWLLYINYVYNQVVSLIHGTAPIDIGGAKG